MKIIKLILIVCVLLTIYSLKSIAQTDTAFWFAAPTATPLHETGYPIIFHLTSFGQASKVTVSMPANPLFTPIDTTVPANQMVNINVTSLKGAIETLPYDSVLNKGLKITATSPVTVYYQIGQAHNPEIYVLKGKNALGTNFVIPGQNKYPNDSAKFNNTAKSSIDIVATEDSTTVKVILSHDAVPNNITGLPLYHAGDTLIIKLNKGDSYSVLCYDKSGSDHLVGSRVISDKPIAVSIKDDSVWIGGSQDLMGDQIVPTNIIGTDYIAVKGAFTISSDEGVFVTAIQDATGINVNGTNVATINADATYFIPYTSSLNVFYIQTSKPTYAFQLTGGGYEVAGSLLPQLTCTGSNKVAFARETTDEFLLKLVAPKNIINYFYLSVNNGPSIQIDSNRFEPVPGTNFMYARIFYNTDTVPANAQCVITNAQGVFQMAFMNMCGGTSGAVQGYFSNFNYGGSSTSLQNRFAGCDVTLSVDPSFTNYIWTDANFNKAINDTTNTLTFKITNKVKDTIVYSMASNGGCLDTVKFDVTPKSPIAGFKQKLCASGLDSIKLSFDTTQYYTGFKWIDSLKGDSIHTKIYVKLQNKDTIIKLWFWDHTCIAPADSFLVSYFPKPNLRLPNDTIICNGSPLKIYNLKPNPPGLANQWSTGATTDTITPPTTVSKTDSTYYKLTITNGCNESFSDSMKVVILHNVTPQAEIRYVSCSVDLQVDAGKKFFDWYSFKNNAWSKIDSVTNVVNVMSPDSTIMTVSSAGICNDSNYFYIHFTKPIAGFKDSICGTSNDSIMLHFNPKACLIPTANFHWFDKINGNSTDTAVYVKQDGIYEVYFWDGNCLADSGVYIVKIDEKPQLKLPNDTTVCNGSPVKIFNQKTKSYGMQYKWSTGETSDTIKPSTSVSKTETLSYMLTVINACNFSLSDTMNIKVLYTVYPHSDIRFDNCISRLTSNAGETPYQWFAIENNIKKNMNEPDTTSIITVMKPIDSVMVVSQGKVCADTNYFYINYSLPKAGLDTSLCASGNDSVKLSFNPAQYYTKYKWFDSIRGDSTSNPKYVYQQGTYKLFFFDRECIAPPGIFKVIYFQDPLAKLPNDTTVCNGSPVKIYNLKTNPAGMSKWSTGETTDTIKPQTSVLMTDSTTYKLTVTNNCNKSASDEMQVKVLYTVYPHSETHFDNCSAMLSVKTGQKPYEWFSIVNKVKSLLTDTTNAISVMNPVVSVMSISQGKICKDTNYFNIVYILPKAGFNQNICKTGGDSAKLNFDTTQYYTKFKWFDSINGDSIHFGKYVKAQGIYKIFFFDQVCPAPPGIFTIYFYPKPTISLTEPSPVCSDSAFTLDAGNQEGMKIQWMLDGNSNIKDTNQTFYIKLPKEKQDASADLNCSVTVINTCKDSDSSNVILRFIDCNITIPNVFTPNGDGINDYLYIAKIDSVSYLDWEVIIFNRWGRKIYETTKYINGDPSHSWNGEGSSEGVYYYVARNFKKNLKYTGFVELIR